MVLGRNLNADFVSGIVTRTDADTFDIPCVDSGPTEGTGGAYALGFTFVHAGDPGAITGGTLVAPAGGDVQLISLRQHLAAAERLGITYTLVLPASATNGAGANTGNDDLYIPFLSARQDSDGMGAIGATLAKNVGGSFHSFQVGALPPSTIGLFLSWQF